MFEKITPPAKGLSNQLSRGVRKLLFVVFRCLAGIAVLGFFVMPMWSVAQIALCFAAFVGAAGFYAIAESFRDEDGT